MKFTVLITLVLSSLLSFGQRPGGGRPGGGGMERPSPEQKAKYDTKKMKKKLSLNEAQTKQFHKVALKYGKLSEKVMESIPKDQFPPSEETRTSMRAQMMEINKDKNTELKAILTSEQFENYQKLQKEERQNFRQGGGRPGQ